MTTEPQRIGTIVTHANHYQWDVWVKDVTGHLTPHGKAGPIVGRFNFISGFPHQVTHVSGELARELTNDDDIATVLDEITWSLINHPNWETGGNGFPD
ncbi:hypothetical protein [Haloglycomyces albus]|uniref:hypothetical protein n=1 Tax=Haloglycomyces albus TaxID=526067 RepID=UPI00046CA4D2|nr:hypothetical protein [Haloglycomyces albus]